MDRVNEQSRQELLNELDRRVEDGIIEKSNADLLKKLIQSADTLTEAIAIAELGTTYKRTGFHFDKRLEKTEPAIKYFKKNEDLSFSDGTDNAPNKLIIGDNYDALLNLLIQYKGKIDVIYIDPPYSKNKMGEFADGGYEYAGKCFISNAGCYDDARAVADLIEEQFPNLNGKVVINSVGTTIGSHTGPGTVALFFWGFKREN